MTSLYVATEDALSEAVVDRLVAGVNNGLLIDGRLGRKGNSYLRKKFPELLVLARKIPVFLLTDLDQIDCPPTLVGNWIGRFDPPPGMLFRVAVREVEAWLLADREGFAKYFDVPLSKLPLNSESVDDPKQLLLNLVRRYSKREIKAAILPERGSLAKVGFGYNQMLGRFVEEQWSIRRAMAASDSLARAHLRLTELSVGSLA
jgi:hypothetical protein